MDLVAIDVTLVRQTEKAGLFQIANKEVWISWKLIRFDYEDIGKDGESGTILIPKWLAEKEGLEYDDVD